jgi:hypothetical protein
MPIFDETENSESKTKYSEKIDIPSVSNFEETGEQKMKLKDLAEKLGWELKTRNVSIEAEVKTGYASDLLSDVLANSIEGDLWVTRQSHLNIVAIAVMRDLSGILLANGVTPDPDTIEKATEKMVPIFRTPLPTFEVVGKLYQMGISGAR